MTGGFACLDICWHPANFLLPHLRPELAALLQVLALLKLLLSEVAAQHRVAVLVDSVGEVLAGHADDDTPRLERERLLALRQL